MDSNVTAKSDFWAERIQAFRESVFLSKFSLGYAMLSFNKSGKAEVWPWNRFLQKNS